MNAAFVGIFLLCSQIAQSNSSELSDLTLDAQKGYLAKIKSISTLDVEYTSDWSNADVVENIRWTRNGQKHRYRTNRDDNGMYVELFDGSIRWTISFENLRPTQTLKRPQDGNVYPYILGVEEMLGLRFFGHNGNVKELLMHQESQIVQRIIIDGDNCIEIKCPDIYCEDGSEANHIRLFLNKDKDYLPKRIVIFNCSSELNKKDTRSWFYDLNIEDYFKVTDAYDGKIKWFPRKAVARQANGIDVKYQVEQVFINEDIPDSIFRTSNVE